MRGVLSLAPLDLVDLLFNFERLKIVEFWFVRLELGVELVLAAFFLYIFEYALSGRTMSMVSWLQDNE